MYNRITTSPTVVYLPTFYWLRTSGINTNWAAAKVIDFDRLEKKYALAWEDKRRLTGVITQKRHLSESIKSAVTPLVLTPFVPFRASMTEKTGCAPAPRAAPSRLAMFGTMTSETRSKKYWRAYTVSSQNSNFARMQGNLSYVKVI